VYPLKDRNLVLLLDPRGVILNGGTDVIERHFLYSQSLKKISKPNYLSFLVLSASNESEMNSYSKGGLLISNISKPTFNSFVFAIKAFRYLKLQKIHPRLLIAGDPWESYWSAHILNKLLGLAIPIQVQVHGDISDLNWRKLSYKNRVRFFLAKKSLRNADSIRCVSRMQKFSLSKIFALNGNFISVIPVPILTNFRVSRLLRRPRTIGFIGRIHEDRGIWNFVKLVKNLNKLDTAFKLLIAGDGPARDEFLHQLEKVIPKNRIKYLGQISQGKLWSSWKSIGVLVSMAPVESYGRVLRESLLAGVPVWATASSGVVDLLDSAEPGTVKKLDLEKDESQLHEDFESLLKVKVGSKFRDKFIKENNSYADKLAKSWIDTIENFKK
jgi:glycosyltransferase involved in cell wall biosynthesis